MNSEKYAGREGYQALLTYLRESFTQGGIDVSEIEVDANGWPTDAMVERVRSGLKMLGFDGSRRRRWIASALAELRRGQVVPWADPIVAEIFADCQ